MWRVVTGVVMLGIAGCASAPPHVVATPRNTLLAVRYHANRSTAILRAHRDARRFCGEQGRVPMVLKEDTVYQGRYDETVNESAKIAGRVADIYGSSEGASLGRVLSSPTDYKSTVEFTCQ